MFYIWFDCSLQDAVPGVAISVCCLSIPLTVLARHVSELCNYINVTIHTNVHYIHIEYIASIFPFRTR